jgi:plasmid replication initiation protein
MTELAELTDEQIPSILDNQVSITNLAARSAQGFTLREKRLVMAGLSKFDSRKKKNLITLKDRTFRVTASEYVDLSQIADEKSAYKDLLAACEKLLDRRLRYKIITPRGVKERVLQWVGGVTYHHGEGWVEFSISEEIMPHVCELTKQFTQYRLRQTSELRSIYSWRLLELLTSHNNSKDETKITVKKIPLNDLSSALEIPNTYRYCHVKARVIEPAVAELVKKDHWLIQWRPIKEGRAVAAIEFTFSRTPKNRLPTGEWQDVDWIDEFKVD